VCGFFLPSRGWAWAVGGLYLVCVLLAGAAASYAAFFMRLRQTALTPDGEKEFWARTVLLYGALDFATLIRRCMIPEGALQEEPQHAEFPHLTRV
jgi:hypothetical protein